MSISITIRTWTDGRVLFQGPYKSFKTALEQAVARKVNLHFADLRKQNLSNALLDDGLLAGADFSCTNLAGANLSEADLRRCKFHNTALYNTCFAYSNLQGSRFYGASFGATDITGADISKGRFNTESCFSLNYRLAASMGECAYVDGSGRFHSMNRPPVVIWGLETRPVVYLDRGMLNLPTMQAPFSGTSHQNPAGDSSAQTSKKGA